MAAVSGVLSENLLCSFCLEVFTDPVSTSCGHSFCKTCLDHHWDQSFIYKCPVCEEIFSSRPQLKTNSCLSQMVSQFKPEEAAPGLGAEAGGVPCDVCSEPRLQALKSCLVCLASYCHNHLEPHHNNSLLRRHQLINPVKNMDERVCSQHHQPLKLFCKTDQKVICLQCSFEEHKSHNTVPMKEECETHRTELKEMIKERREKIQQIQDLVEVNHTNAEREVSEGVKVFTDLIECVEKSLHHFKKRITEEQENTEEEATALIEELEQEVSEMERVLLSEDHLYFLQIFNILKLMRCYFSDSTVSPPSYKGLEVSTVSELQTTIHSQIQKVFEAELKRVQEFEVDVTLDAATAHPNIVLSNNDKQVSYSNIQKDLPDVPERFSTSLCVLGKQKFSSGRSYFQVQVKGKTAWVLGVAEELIDRKRKVTLSPQNGYWTISLRNNTQFWADAGPSIPLSLMSSPQMVGVFVDYDEGLVCFYDVDTAALIYSFTQCSFKDHLLPILGPQPNVNIKNSAPLILTPAQVPPNQI